MSALIEQVMQASAGSRYGMHYYSNAAKCGMRAYLRDQSHTDEAVAMAATEDKHALKVGTIYHRLHEMWRLGMLDRESEASAGNAAEALAATLAPLHEHPDASLQEALRLFHGYQSHWPKDLWGRCHGIELLLPSRDAETEAVREAMGDVEVTGKLDMVAHIDEAALPQAQERCPEITEPGTYIIDWKTAGKTPDPLLYKLDVQALWYPTLYTLCMRTSEGGRDMLKRFPVRGVIFDVIIKHRRTREPSFTPSDFACVFAPAPSVDQAMSELRGLIEQGTLNVMRARNYATGNRAECVTASFGSANICPFYGTQCLGG